MTPEELKVIRARTCDEVGCPACEQNRILLSHIDTQAAHIAELEAEVARLRNTNALDDAKSERLIQRINETLG